MYELNTLEVSVIGLIVRENKDEYSFLQEHQHLIRVLSMGWKL